MIISFETNLPTANTLRQIEEQGDDVRKTIRDTFYFMGVELKKKISANIKDTSQKTGNVYFVRKKGRRVRHQASAPFETHADLSGVLRRSLAFKVQGTENLKIGYGVNPNRDAPVYALIEFGFGNIQPRPSIANVLDDPPNTHNLEFETFFERRLEQLALK